MKVYRYRCPSCGIVGYWDAKSKGKAVYEWNQNRRHQKNIGGIEKMEEVKLNLEDITEPSDAAAGEVFFDKDGVTPLTGRKLGAAKARAHKKPADTMTEVERKEATKPAREARKAARDANKLIELDIEPKAARDLLEENQPVNDDLLLASSWTDKVTPTEAARSSIAATAKAANPANVAELREIGGKLYSVEDVAAALGVTSRSILNYIKDGSLIARKIGGVWKVTADNYKRYIEGNGA
jgi:hypothetical protein